MTQIGFVTKVEDPPATIDDQKFITFGLSEQDISGYLSVKIGIQSITYHCNRKNTPSTSRTP